MGWYCPKCGLAAAETRGVWRCAGGMEFTISLGRQIADIYKDSYLPARKPAV